MPMMLKTLPVLIGLLLLGVGHAIPKEKLQGNFNGEFRHIGGTLACITDSLSEEGGYHPCLHIGPVEMGANIAEVEAMFGKPWRTIPHSDSDEIRVYVLKSKREPLPYLVVTFREQKVAVIQMTGFQTEDSLAFSSIELGDAQKQVIRILGKPVSKHTGPQIKGELWSYKPFPISLEIKDQKVFSIRIWKP